MSRCGRTEQLESLLTQEDPALRAHARSCALCRHELAWLETEAALFRQRSGRDEVGQLWAELKPARRPWGGVVAVVAACAAAVLVLLPERGGVEADEGPLQTDALMTPLLVLEEEETCSRLPSGIGFTCAPTPAASMLASR